MPKYFTAIATVLSVASLAMAQGAPQPPTSSEAKSACIAIYHALYASVSAGDKSAATELVRGFKQMQKYVADPNEIAQEVKYVDGFQTKFPQLFRPPTANPGSGPVIMMNVDGKNSGGFTWRLPDALAKELADEKGSKPAVLVIDKQMNGTLFHSDVTAKELARQLQKQNLVKAAGSSQ